MSDVLPILSEEPPRGDRFRVKIETRSGRMYLGVAEVTYEDFNQMASGLSSANTICQLEVAEGFIAVPMKDIWEIGALRLPLGEGVPGEELARRTS